MSAKPLNVFAEKASLERSVQVSSSYTARALSCHSCNCFTEAIKKIHIYVAYDYLHQLSVWFSSGM